jgi:hypothetical protein
MRVNSPGAASAAACGGPFTTCVETCGGGSLAGAGGAGRWVMELNICVNSPAAEPTLAAGLPPPGPGPETGADGAAAGAAFTPCGANGSSDFASCFPSWSNARRNMPVALSGSGCSGPELELSFFIAKRSCSARRLPPHGRIPLRGGPGGLGIIAKPSLHSCPSGVKGPAVSTGPARLPELSGPITFGRELLHRFFRS